MYAVSAVNHLMLMFNSSVNFLIYCAVGSRFRSALTCRLRSHGSGSRHHNNARTNNNATDGLQLVTLHNGNGALPHHGVRRTASLRPQMLAGAARVPSPSALSMCGAEHRPLMHTGSLTQQPHVTASVTKSEPLGRLITAGSASLSGGRTGGGADTWL
jgi:hypothetical protein